MSTRLLAFALLLVALLGSGCADLKEVREFAGESARLASYKELTVRFRDTYSREEPYLYGDAAKIAKINDAARKAIFEDLMRLHDGVMLYMATLATLAGDDTFDLSKGIEGLAKGIKSIPDAGLTAKHVDAFASLAKIVARWATSAYQQRAIREMVVESDIPLQAVLEGLSSVVQYYAKTMANERATVLGIFRVQLPFTDDQKERLLQILARAHMQTKIAEYALHQTKHAELEKGIKAIADGHRKLRENVERLSSSEARGLLSEIVRDLRTIRSNLQALQQP